MISIDSVPLSFDMAGNAINIKTYTFGKGTPRVYIQGGTHGGEVTFWIINKLYEYLSRSEVSGTVTLVPIANPFAWNQRIYYSTVGKINLQTGEDWNRGFTNSNTSLAKRRAKIIMDYVKNYDFSIDLHTSRKSIPFSILPKETYDTKLLNILGMQYNYLLSNQSDDSMMSLFSQNKSTDGFEIECGSTDEYNEKNISLVTLTLLRFLEYVKIITHATKSEPIEQLTFENFKTYYADTPGIIGSILQPGEKYRRDTILYTIYPSRDYFKPVVIRAEENGIVIKCIPTSIIWEGDEVMQNINLNQIRST